MNIKLHTQLIYNDEDIGDPQDVAIGETVVHNKIIAHPEQVWKKIHITISQIQK